MTHHQPTLAGIERPTPAGNRGRYWQDILCRQHGRYEHAGEGKVYEIPNAWAYTPFFVWKNLPAVCRARTAEGGYLARKKSAPDFIGSLGPWPIQFDAKQFDGASIPYDNFSEGQIADLNASFGGDNLYAGFMVLESRHGRVWWLRADYVHAWHLSIKRNVPGVAKSINFSKLDLQDPLISRAVKLLGVCDGRAFDYAPALIHGFSERFPRT